MLLCLCCYLKIISYYRLFFNCVTNSCSHDFEKVLLFSLSDSVGIRTQDPQIRNLLLYPAELRNQTIERFGDEGESLHL